MAATLINSSSNANSLMNLAGDNCVSSNLCNSINSNLLDQLDHSTAIRSKIALSDINNNSNSNNAISQNDLISTNLIVSNLNTSANNHHPTDTADSNQESSHNNNFVNSTDMIKIKQPSSISSSVENSPQQQDYHLLNNKKSTETINKGGSYGLNGLYAENAMDIKYINSDCVIYTFYTNLNTEIDNHFKRALNKSIYNNDNKNKDANDQLSSTPLNQRNLPASFWNRNYFNQQQQSQLQQQTNYQSNLVNNYYLPLIEPSASTSTLQPLLQLETLSQLTHLQNHTQTSSQSNSSTNFTPNQNSTQNTSSSASLINNSINSLTSFAHHLHNHPPTGNNFSSLDHQKLTNAQLNSNSQSISTSLSTQHSIGQQSATATDLSTQPQFLHHLLQQQSNSHAFQQYATATQNPTTSTIQPTVDSNNLLNSQTIQQQHSNLAHYNSTTEASNNNWSPHSVFIPLASPASSSSCSSNAENNVNRSNKLTNLTNSSLTKHYDLTKPTARFALTSSALLQLNSTGTSPNRSPLSTTTSSPAAQLSQNNTLSPVTFHSTAQNAYQLSNLEKQHNLNNSVLFPNLTSSSQNQSNNQTELNTNYSSTSSPVPTTNNNSLVSSTGSTFAKSFTNHFAHQSSDPWAAHHSSNSTTTAHQPYLSIHSAHNLTGYHTSSTGSNSSATALNGLENLNKADQAGYNQYNSLLTSTGSINSNSIHDTNNTSLSTTSSSTALTTAKSISAANTLQHTSLAHSTMPNHLTNYNYYHLNPLNQINSLANTPTETATPTAAINFHSTANSYNFHHHHYHHNGYNSYNYGLSMTGFDNQVTDGPAKDLYWF